MRIPDSQDRCSLQKIQDMQGLSTSDYKGSSFWKAINESKDDEDEEVFKFRECPASRAFSICLMCSLCVRQTSPAHILTALVMKNRVRGASVGSTSGISTPGLLGSKTLSARDLDRADEALSAHDTRANGH